MYQTKIINERLFIPNWMLEDAPIDNKFIISRKEGCTITTIGYQEYKDLHRSAYFACRWYPKLIDSKVPVISSELKLTTFLDLRGSLSQMLTEKKFVRLCNASPKDIIDVPIFSDPNEAVNAIQNSQRCKYTHPDGNIHLFVRDVVDIRIEARCFIHQHKLRAISVYQFIPLEDRKEYEESILDFFELYIDKLIYNSCVVEIGLDDFPFVIEFNDFGIDGYAGASLFDWDTDASILYASMIPEFRYPNEYSF